MFAVFYRLLISPFSLSDTSGYRSEQLSKKDGSKAPAQRTDKGVLSEFLQNQSDGFCVLWLSLSVIDTVYYFLYTG